MEKDGESVITFKEILAGVLPLQVHSGTINAVIKYKKSIAEHSFSKKKELQLYEFKLTEGSEEVYDYSPIKVFITCTEPKCVYSIGLLDTTND